MVDQFLRAFIPLFVAFNMIGVVPLFISLTEGMKRQDRARLISQATMTAFIVACLFMLAGTMLFSFLGITVHDFRVGGGLVLLVLSISDLLFSVIDKRRSPDQTVGVVPIGVPLIMGPAALTTLLVVIHDAGYLLAAISLLLNLLLVWFAFRNANILIRVLGEGGAKAFAKVMQLFLTAIAIKMIRSGIEGMEFLQ